MKLKLLQVLGCPKCHEELELTGAETVDNEEIVAGLLECHKCDMNWPIKSGIPRFVQSENYASSFGYQWNQFKKVQIDSINGIEQSKRRLHSETEWDREWIAGKWVLDGGCGAGRFLEIASRDDCEVVGVDISNAVDAAAETLGSRENVHLVQASIFELPFRNGVIDACYCIGVIQHTPDPELALNELPRVLKTRGKLAVTIYERKTYTLFNSKYLVRPLTRRFNPKVLLVLLRGIMPVLWPLTELLFRIPFLGQLFRFVIPIANYPEDTELTWKQRYQWAVLDTFDMLSPRYDLPQKEEDVINVLQGSGVCQIRRLNNPGLNMVGLRG
jgi:ubiquinone/menaquinone biosynthesis C-methylase UbiE